MPEPSACTAAVADDNVRRGLRRSHTTALASLLESFRVEIQGNNPEHCVCSPDSQWLLTSNEISQSTDVITVHQSVVTIKTAGAGAPVSGAVAVIDPQISPVIAAVPAGKRPANMALTANESTLYVVSEVR